MAEQLTGVAASPGLAVAQAVRWDGAAGAGDVERATDLDDAAGRVVADLQQRAAAAGTPEGSAVLEALAMFAGDPELLATAKRRVADGEEPAAAIRAAAAVYADQLRALRGYMGERADDVVDVGERIAGALEGRAEASLPSPGYPYVLVARDLSPADTALLDPAVVVALVTEAGGPTSHTAILSRSLGIPAVVACRGAREAMDGQRVVIDGDRGVVYVEPDDATVERLQGDEERRRARAASAVGPGRTRDGQAVPLLANVGSVADAVAAADSGAEGIGLFRTEFLFLGRDDEPGLEEQVATYTAVLQAFPGRRVVVRTLDAGSDKPLPFLELPDEENPALGVRGLRTATVRPQVLDTQLQALAAAGARTGAQLWVMAPMVATVTETQWFAAQARAHGLQQVGIMVEVPAAALRCRHLLAEVDFASIGTNDLGQYTMAADRQHGSMGSLLDAWQPALLDLVAATTAGAGALERPVGVCGEAAADPELAAVLVGLGVRSLSMSTSALGSVRALLAEVDLAGCEKAAEAALQAATAAEAREAVTVLLSP